MPKLSYGNTKNAMELPEMMMMNMEVANFMLYTIDLMSVKCEGELQTPTARVFFVQYETFFQYKEVNSQI